MLNLTKDLIYKSSTTILKVFYVCRKRKRMFKQWILSFVTDLYPNGTEQKFPTYLNNHVGQKSVLISLSNSKVFEYLGYFFIIYLIESFSLFQNQKIFAIEYDIQFSMHFKNIAKLIYRSLYPFKSLFVYK